MNTKKKNLNRKKNCQAGKLRKFLDFVFLKAERSERDRMQQDFHFASKFPGTVLSCFLHPNMH